ncbi:M3 family metallopeptidase [Alloprevotella sp. oral taxon 473]|uniref:M3 family metallopeptidase n=1 Tax=Alloprevotella sp. oral taxon 473 TaxID=712469 RepID=UPI0002A2C3D9|nr:M3 family metallopeptidase [Alloprevotella sp. oral taxon 473]EKX88828.1 putative peptidyl-dipeptidase dcp [Alloprevotella sp. oral taxon 473 str. F0040]
MNLLLQPNWQTPHNTFPFPDISIADIEVAIKEGIRIEAEEVANIASQSTPPTFENTIVALSATGQILEKATTLMYNQLSACTSEELEQLAERMSPLLSEHSSNIMLNEALFARVKAVYDLERLEPTLQEEDKMLLEKTFDGFERSGATLDSQKKERFRAIKAELSKTSLKFSQNNIKETNAFYLHLTDKSQLKGLPKSQVDQAELAAQEKSLEGWVITLHAPSFVPFMQYSEVRELREQLYRAYMTKCTKDNEYNNFDVCRKLVNLRMELAQLFGYPNYATYVLKNRMAETPDKVYELLENLKIYYFESGKHDVAAVEALAKEQEGKDFTLQPWDFAHYSHLLQLRDYNLDAEMLRPYLELSNVTSGVFNLATTLYGITFEENKDIPVYHPDVKAYDVLDNDGVFLAVLYTDFFPRTSKQSGAWMTSYQEEYIDDKGEHRPHVSVTMNFTKPTKNTPSLLTFDELETFLHEFGHALHGIFAKTRYKSLSGTNVYWDFVELPSQFMENYALRPEFLRTFAKHYQTGEDIPQNLIERIRKAHNFNAAYACMRQVSFGLLDMAYYTRTKPLEEDLRSFEHQAWQSVQLLPRMEEACMSVQFGHIMSGGYAAGYYSYKWAEVLDADAFSAFMERGLFSREVAKDFREKILSRGGTVHPQKLYNDFRGRPATIQAMLKRDGLQLPDQ